MEGRDVAGPSASGGPEHQPSEGKRLDRLLVATDGSSRSMHAIRFAVELASEHQSEVLFVHVIPMVEGGTARAGEMRDAVLQTPTEHDQTVLDDAAAIARDRGVAARSAVLIGSAAAAIVSYAESHDVNMIIVGSRGDDDLASALLGNVSLHVLRTSERPLLIVDGDKSLTYCGNGSCRDVRMYGQSATKDASSPAQSHVAAVSGGTPDDFMTTIKWSHRRVTSGVPDTVAHSPSTGPGPHLRPGSGNVPARATSERVAGRVPSLLALLTGAIRLETIVMVAEDAWAITATIPYEGEILLAEFTTRDSASEWFAIAKTLIRS